MTEILTLPDTRQTLLQAAFAEIYHKGYQATGLTKGALSHYFPDKKSLGLAVVEHPVNCGFSWLSRAIGQLP